MLILMKRPGRLVHMIYGVIKSGWPFSSRYPDGGACNSRGYLTLVFLVVKLIIELDLDIIANQYNDSNTPSDEIAPGRHV